MRHEPAPHSAEPSHDTPAITPGQRFRLQSPQPTFGGPQGPGVTRMDTHCHSKASDGPAIAALGAIGCPECFSEPEAVYDQAKARGMDLVTITDHDTIDGAMTLVERGFQDFVVGQEVSVLFPEDRCKLHVLVWGLTPEHQEELNLGGLRHDVYAFASWLRDHNLAHAFAHPLYLQNGRLTRWHVERASLLFKGFETLNGAHPAKHKHALERFLKTLTPARVHRLVNQHQLEPLWPRIWEKGLTAGSDDHGLMNVGRTFTAVPGDAKITEPAEFLRTVMQGGRSEACGVGGHSSLLAHQFTTVGAHYYAERLGVRGSAMAREVTRKLVRFAGIDLPKTSRAKLAAHVAKKRLFRRKGRAAPLLDALKESFGPVLDQYPEVKARLKADPIRDGSAMSDHDQMADFVDDLSAAMGRALGAGAIHSFKKKDRNALTDHLSSYALLQLTALPYMVSLFYQNKERQFLERFEHDTAKVDGAPGVLERPMRVSLFTDTLGDVNGVSRFIQNVGDQAEVTGRDLQIITCTRLDVPDKPNVFNFDPVFAWQMPKYDQLEVALPPLMKIMRHVDKHQPDAIHVSTPGPMGMVGLVVAKMLRVPVLGVYHTDFPAYIDALFEDHAMTHFTTKFMRVFYGGFRSIFTRSEDYVEALTRIGIPRQRSLRLMPGCDVHMFHPRFEDQSIWDRLDADGATASKKAKSTPVRVLYCGRVSVEKNLPMLTGVWKKVAQRLKEQQLEAELVIVGDGPYRPRMEKELKGANVRFCGFRYDDELSTIYASTDMFVFPSVTDTLGQVVMESQASGQPVLVTDQGGPKEVVEHGRTGFVIGAGDVEGWVETIVDLIGDGEKRRAMGAAAHESLQKYSIRNSFEHFWQVHVEAWHEHLATLGITPDSDGPAEPAVRTPSEAPSPETAPIAR
ncbi:MAG: glycosyltransferase [Planctomycetota bacterium]